MARRDTEVSDIFIVLKAKCADKFDQAIAALQKLGMNIASTDPDDGVVEGTVPVDKIGELRIWDCVEDLRIDFTYIAEDES